MAGLTDYAENKILDHAYGTTSWAMPAASYVALFTAAPSDAGGGTEVAATNGYARQSVTWNAAASGQKTNSSVPSFAASGGNWGTVTHFAIFDALSGGNMIGWAALPSPRVFNDGDSGSFGAGGLVLTLD